MEGYAIKTAGEGIDPGHWEIEIDEIDIDTRKIVNHDLSIAEERNKK